MPHARLPDPPHAEPAEASPFTSHSRVCAGSMTASTSSVAAMLMALAQHAREERHTQVRGGHEHAADLGHLRLGLRLGPDHEARRVHQRHQRQTLRVAQLHEARCLVGGGGVDGAAQVRRLIRVQIGSAATERAWASGATMTLAEALDLAAQSLQPPA